LVPDRRRRRGGGGGGRRERRRRGIFVWGRRKEEEGEAIFRLFVYGRGVVCRRRAVPCSGWTRSTPGAVREAAGWARFVCARFCVQMEGTPAIVWPAAAVSEDRNIFPGFPSDMLLQKRTWHLILMHWPVCMYRNFLDIF
jgi:hypothetical protein